MTDEKETRMIMGIVTDAMVKDAEAAGEAMPVVQEIIGVMLKHKDKLSESGIKMLKDLLLKIFGDVLPAALESEDDIKEKAIDVLIKEIDSGGWIKGPSDKASMEHYFGRAYNAGKQNKGDNNDRS